MAEDKAPKDYGIGGNGSADGGYPQCLLRRKPELSVQEFHAGWIEHARFGLPWGADCGMTHYVQIRNPTVANPAAMPAGIDIKDFDAVAELHIPSETPGTEADKAMRGAYFEQCIIPDECRYFAGPNRDLAVWIPPGTATGERIEVMVNGEWVKDADGKPVLDLEQSTRNYEDWKKKYRAEHNL